VKKNQTTQLNRRGAVGSTAWLGHPLASLLLPLVVLINHGVCGLARGESAAQVISNVVVGLERTIHCGNQMDGVNQERVYWWNKTPVLIGCALVNPPILQGHLNSQLANLPSLIGAPLKQNSNEAKDASHRRAGDSANERGKNSVAHNKDWVWAIIGYVIGFSLTCCAIIWWSVLRRPNEPGEAQRPGAPLRLQQ
jgi:hypothetical protein